MTGQNHEIASLKEADRQSREYGRKGLFGILTPQGNPTVEPEMSVLLPAGSAMFTTRLTSRNPSLRQRLIDYWERLDYFLDDFEMLNLEAVGFACTGSSYLVDPAEERHRLEVIERARGYPVIPSARAIEDALRHLGIGAVALISPYPEWLTTASRAHWERVGVRVTTVLQLSSDPSQMHPIYGLTSEVVLRQARGFDYQGAEVVLITGTGMPSLKSILALGPALGRPMLSSNLCLAWALARAAGESVAGPESPLLGGWAKRLESA